RFAGRLQTEALDTLTTWADALEPTPADELETLAFGTVTRTVSTSEAVSALVDVLPPGLEEALATAAEQALAQPVAAVEVQATENQLVIAGIGPEPYPVLLFASDIPGYWVRIWRNIPSAPDGRVFLPQAAVQALVDAGQLVEGRIPLKSG